MRIYVASSWRNDFQPAVVDRLRAQGHDVYDFKDSDGFSWREVSDVDESDWDFTGWMNALDHPAAERGFARDMSALATAHRCVMVLPCGRSAHLEAGYAIGQRIPTAILCPRYDGADLMVKMADLVTDSLAEVCDWIGPEVRRAST